YMAVTLFGQLFTHLATLHMASYVVDSDLGRTITSLAGSVKPFETKFSPSMMNTVIFLVSTFLDLSVILVNYAGAPYMQPIVHYFADSAAMDTFRDDLATSVVARHSGSLTSTDVEALFDQECYVVWLTTSSNSIAKRCLPDSDTISEATDAASTIITNFLTSIVGQSTGTIALTSVIDGWQFILSLSL
ncbi:hypothetical protein KIPB_013322, partial [Kipferlia bialata]